MSINFLAKAAFKKMKNILGFHPSVPGIAPLGARFQEELGEERRLNILLPTLNPAHVFGGITTALMFFEKLADTLGVKRRMIITDEDTAPEFVKKYAGYTLTDCGESVISDRQIVPFFQRGGKTIPVGKNDIFLCTAWWTAFTAPSVLDFIQNHCGTAQPMIYFIQDYETCFYPWSSRSALAESTYHTKRDVIAVFNSHELKEYFTLHGYRFFREYFFDPALNTALKKELLKNPPQKKEKKILVYGRPSVPRNCMEIIADALRRWTVLAEDASQWQLLSAGERHPNLSVGQGCVLHSLGKLSIEEYARVMGSCYAGISLMVSPHPSYPPLEMSTFGIKTITNTYENKDLAYFNDNIVSVSDMTPENIAKELLQLTNGFHPQNFHLACDTPYCCRELSFDEICREIGEVLPK